MRITQAEVKAAKTLAEKLEERYIVPSSQLNELEIRAAAIMKGDYFETVTTKGNEQVRYIGARKENFYNQMARAEKQFTESDDTVLHI